MANRTDAVKKVQNTLVTLLNTTKKRIDTSLEQIQVLPEQERDIFTKLLNKQKNDVIRLRESLQQVNLNRQQQPVVNAYSVAKETRGIVTAFEKMSTALDKINNSLPALFAKEVVSPAEFRTNQELLARGQTLLSNKEEGVTKFYKQQMNKFTRNLDKAEQLFNGSDAANKVFVGQNIDDNKESALLDVEFDKQFPRIK